MQPVAHARMPITHLPRQLERPAVLEDEGALWGRAWGMGRGSMEPDVGERAQHKEAHAAQTRQGSHRGSAPDALCVCDSQNLSSQE